MPQIVTTLIFLAYVAAVTCGILAAVPLIMRHQSRPRYRRTENR